MKKSMRPAVRIGIYALCVGSAVILSSCNASKNAANLSGTGAMRAGTGALEEDGEKQGNPIEQVAKPGTQAMSSSQQSMRIGSIAFPESGRTMPEQMKGQILVYLRPESLEVRPEQNLRISIAVENTASTELTNAELIADFPANLAWLTDTGGATAKGNQIRWTIQNLPAGKTRTLGFSIKPAENLIHGTKLQLNVKIMGGNIVSPATEKTEIIVLRNLPVTGIALRAAAEVGLMMFTGLILGVIVGKKFLA